MQAQHMHGAALEGAHVRPFPRPGMVQAKQVQRCMDDQVHGMHIGGKAKAEGLLPDERPGQDDVTKLRRVAIGRLLRREGQHIGFSIMPEPLAVERVHGRIAREADADLHITMRAHGLACGGDSRLYVGLIGQPGGIDIIIDNGCNHVLFASARS